MKQYYYLTPQNEQKGPVDGSQLAAYGVNANTMVWTQGMAQWAPAGSVAELASVITPAASVPPPSSSPQPQPQPQSVVYVQTNPAGTSQPSMPKPNNHMMMAVLTTVFCCLPLGVVGIVYASKVDGLYYAGDYAGATNAANSARRWSLIGIVSSIVVSIIYMIIYGAAVGSGALLSMSGING